MTLIYLYFLLAFLVAVIAMIRGRSGLPWFLIAVFLTPLIAGLVLLALPKLQPAYWYSEWEDRSLPPGVIPMPANSKLRIVPRFRNPYEQRACEIFVNGAKVGVVEPGAVGDFAVPSGRLSVEACMDWAESEPITVDTAPGQRVDLEVTNHGGALLALWAKAFPTDSYLSLHRAPPLPAREAA